MAVRGTCLLRTAPINIMHSSQSSSSTPPLNIDVLMPLPEGWGICLSCEMLMARAQMAKAPYERGLEEYPPDWLEDLQRFSALIGRLSYRFADDVMIRIYDPRSLQGLWKAIRHRVHRYPAFIIGNKNTISGWDEDVLEQSIDRTLLQRPEPAL